MKWLDKLKSIFLVDKTNKNSIILKSDYKLITNKSHRQSVVSKNGQKNLKKINSNYKIQNKTKHKNILFCSDLHFDYALDKNKQSAISKNENNFIKSILKVKDESILLIAGDIYNDYRETIKFVKKLEYKKILGFFVLGNHDYWNGLHFSIKEILEKFEQNTTDHKYFKFLTTGKIYEIDGYKFIGDTGWSSFKRGDYNVDINNFNSLPEFKEIKNFDLNEIILLHDYWIDFANKVFSENENVIVLTHFPMIDLTILDRDVWWSSTTKLIDHNGWKIFGHIHNKDIFYRQANNVCYCIGYNILSVKKSYFWKKDEEFRNYQFYKKLIWNIYTLDKIDNNNFSIQIINKFYSLKNNEFSNINHEINKIISNGYKRVAANKKNIFCLALKPEKYFKKIEEWLNGNKIFIFANYYIEGDYEYSLIELVRYSLYFLQNNDFSEKFHEYIIAALVTGYVYNNLPLFVSDIRSISNYDLVRFLLFFLIVQKSKNISPNLVRKSKDFLIINKIKIYFPLLDGKGLNQDLVKRIQNEFNNKVFDNNNSHQKEFIKKLLSGK